MKKEFIHPGWKERVLELESKGLIDDNQKETLMQMIDSPDGENGYLAKEIMGNKMAAKIAVGLNPEQTKNFFDLINFFIDPDEDAYVLKGYAGTGKTFLITRVLEYIAVRYPNRAIAITAPTNKAVKVLQQNAPFDKNSNYKLVFDDIFEARLKLDYMTIHKLLGLKESVSLSGEQSFIPDPRNPAKLTDYKYLIVDEVSMLSDDLCHLLLEHSDKVKILFTGDPAQIPPVKRKDCIPFRKQEAYNFKRGELSQIMRQTGENPIVDTSFLLRNNLNIAQPIRKLATNLNDKGEGIVFLDSTKDRKKVRPILKEYFDTDSFKEDANYMKVIAWRNTTVNKMNNIIREILYGENSQEYVVGEKLVVMKPVFEKQKHRYGEWRVLFTTSEELEVKEVRWIERNYLYANGKRCTLMFWELVVGYYDYYLRKNFTETIYTIHQNSFHEWEAYLKTFKERAIKEKSKAAWRKYYDRMKYSADISYNYAITAHKAQGSTYTNVLLIEEDVDFNRDIVERNRIKYTSYSRPTTKLYILRKNYG